MNNKLTLNEMIKNFGGDVSKWFQAGMPITSPPDVMKRKTICKSCEHMVNLRCKKCGCFIFKTYLNNLKCPIGKW